MELEGDASLEVRKRHSLLREHGIGKALSLEFVIF